MASMNSVGVKVEPERNSILSGESLVLHIGVENRGPSGIQIPDPDFENPFTYNLTSVENPALIYQFSLVRYKVTKNPEDRRIQPYSMVALSPGVRAEYAIDLALVMSEPVRPGNYSLRVTYRDRNLSLSSSPVRLRFLSPQPISLATIGNFDKEGISYVMSNREGDQVTLFQWEAERTNPRLGRAFRRADLSLTSASSVASTFEGEAERGRRWISWLADGNLQIERVWGKSLDRTVRPVLVNLSEARLLSPGRVDAQDKARFLVIGSNGHGDELHEFNAAGRVFVKPEGELEALLQEQEQANEPLPGVRRFELGGTAPHLLHVRYYPQAERDGFQLVGVQSKDGARHIVVREFPETDEFRSIYNSEEPLLALSCPPLQSHGVGYVDALFGSLEDDRRLTYFRIPLDSDQKPRKWVFSEDDIYTTVQAEPGTTLENWTLCAGLSENPAVVVVLGSTLVAGFPTAGGHWRAIASALDAPDALELLSTGDHDRYGQSIYAIFISEKDGVLTIPIA